MEIADERHYSESVITTDDTHITVKISFDRAYTGAAIDRCLENLDMEVTEENRNRVYTYQAACHLIILIASQIKDSEHALENLIDDLYQSCASQMKFDKEQKRGMQ